MVLPPSTAAQSEAAEADWLTELRRWLTLGRKGVIVMIRDAQRARLRELVLMLDELEPGFCFDTDATVIADAAPGSLVLLGLQREQLDWLNMNRPLFAERSLRVVLWAESDLAVQVKFHAPDLHDWVSHFVTCPPGVPEFAVAGLEQGIRWWPGVAWTGPGLKLAMAQIPTLAEPLELDPSLTYSEIVENIEMNSGRCLIWHPVETSMALWRIRWAIAEGRHYGPNILDNPTVGTPGWYPASSKQLSIVTAVSMLAGANAHHKAALAELEPAALAGMAGREPSFADIGLLRATGPALRARHESPEVQEWRASLFETMRTAPTPDRAWSRHEMAIFAAEGRRQQSWPEWQVPTRFVWYDIERQLAEGSVIPEKHYITAFMGQHDVLSRWEKLQYSRRDAIGAWVATIFPKNAPTVTLTTLDDWGWDSAPTIAVLQRLLLASTLSPAALSEVFSSAKDQLGATDPQFLFISRLLGLAAGAQKRAAAALIYLQEPARVAEQGRYLLLAGADFELTVVLALLGRYEVALADFEGACERAESPPGFEHFHRLTRAALGHAPVDDLTDLLPTQPLSIQLETEGSDLLLNRLRAIQIVP